MANRTQSSSTVWIVLLLVFTFPIWFGLAAGAFGIVIGVFAAIGGIFIGLFSAVGGIFAGLFSVIFSILMIPVDIIFGNDSDNWHPFHFFYRSGITIVFLILLTIFVMRSRKKSSH